MKQILLTTCCLFTTSLCVSVAGANNIYDTKTLEAFVDGVVKTSMEEHHVAGTVVAITTPDKVLLSKGYGFADVELKIAVTPEETLFRIGSISKLFVWVPVMQLVEQGKLDLNTDVNDYLTSIEVPEAFGEPITIADLMTHTAGFEDHVIGLFSRTASSMKPLSEILNNEMPLRVRPPGQYASYSNHGVGIVGLIIEEVSGQSWPDYVKEHVLEPLKMNMTTMHQPVPEALEEYLSRGYSYEAGRYVPQEFEYVPLSAAGGTSATASDMTRFMQMFLGAGELDGVRIFTSSTAKTMQTSLFRPIPEFNGTMHGLYESSSHGQLIIGHGGDTIWFHSELMLMPEPGLGIFISTNSADGHRIRSAIRKALLDRYFPASESTPGEFSRTDLSKIVGTYGSLRHAHDDLTKIIKLMSPINISATSEGQLMLSGALNGEHPSYFDEVAPLIFQRPGYETKISFELDNDGIASHLFINEFPIVAFEKMTGLNSVPFNFFILGFSVFISLWILIIWTIQHQLRRTMLPAVLANYRTIAWLHSTTVVIFLVGLSIGIADQYAIVFGLSTVVKATLLWAYVVMLFSLCVAWLTPGVVLSADTGKVAKIGYLMVTLSGLGFSWFLYHWRMFSW